MSELLIDREVNAGQNSLDEALLACVTANVPPLLDSQVRAPETSGAFSFEDNFLFPGRPAYYEQSPGGSIIGDVLPPIVSQEEQLALMQESELMGELMQQARLSKITGCILRPDLFRNQNGYSKVKSSVANEIGLGSYTEIQRLSFFLYKTMTTGELPTAEEKSMQVDHTCRDGACGNPSHYRLINSKENNQLKDKAGKIEPVIIRGQLFYLTDLLNKMPWLEHAITQEGEELPEKVISTRMGPFALRLASPPEGIVYGERVPCGIFDSLRPLGKNNYVAPSRAKRQRYVKGQKAMYRKDKFTKKTPLPKQKDLYKEAMAA